jgi:hypothetical protein
MRALYLTIGLAIIAIGLTVAGYAPHPWLGAAIILLGVLVASWPYVRPFLGDHRPEPVRRMAQLLREIASDLREIGAKRKPNRRPTDKEVGDWGWYWARLVAFLKQGFMPHVLTEFDANLEAYEKKHDGKFSDEACALYLEKLAARLASTDVDLGFAPPVTFAQFVHNVNWPENVQRP